MEFGFENPLRHRLIGQGMPSLQTSVVILERLICCFWCLQKIFIKFMCLWLISWHLGITNWIESVPHIAPVFCKRLFYLSNSGVFICSLFTLFASSIFLACVKHFNRLFACYNSLASFYSLWPCDPAFLVVPTGSSNRLRAFIGIASYMTGSFTSLLYVCVQSDGYAFSTLTFR